MVRWLVCNNRIIFYLITHIHFLWLHVASGTNPGEAFGQCGIRIYGKKFLTRGKNLRVQFNYRARKRQKATQVVRLPVDSAKDADDAIRIWLQNKTEKSLSYSKYRNKTSTTAECETLFLQPIAASVMEPSYVEYQNRKRKHGRTGQQTKPTESTTSAIIKQVETCKICPAQEK